MALEDFAISFVREITTVRKSTKKIKKALTGRKIPVDVREKYAKSIKAVKNDPDWKAKDALRREQKYRLAQFDDLCHTQKRRRVLEEQNFKCNVCQSDQMHNGKPLVFQLDHINGNRKDETRQNLQFLCPNCHSQTPTYGVRNISEDGKRRQALARRRGIKRPWKKNQSLREIE